MEPTRKLLKTTMSKHKQQVTDVLKSFETGDPAPLSSINPRKYIQHNLNLGDGLAALQARLASRPKGSVKARPIRVFEDGDFVFTHTEFEFAGKPRVAFEIFRFEIDQIVEHWDNLQEMASERSPSGHTMTDGPTIASDLDRTEANKALMRTYMDDLLAGRTGYFTGNSYIQHNPWLADDLTGLVSGWQTLAAKGSAVKYDQVHRVIGEGNFVLVASEGSFGARPTAHYDLYRIENGKIAEHWDTIGAIPPRADRKNPNGKF
jgi:predicted SnoaL-like aldol condensation-catalyzing enzyme